MRELGVRRRRRSGRRYPYFPAGLRTEAIVDPDAVAAGLFGDMLALAYDGNAARSGRLPEDRG